MMHLRKKCVGEGSYVNNALLFQFSQILAIIGWVALALSFWRRSYCISFARGIALVQAVSYGIQLATNTESVDGGSFSTLSGVTAVFSTEPNVMLGWTHYLVFDLLIGSWEAEDAPKSGVPHWLLIPCLFFTLMLGPIGLLLYVIVRTFFRGRASA
jgi:Domain of unknown function (DUF4281)